MKTLKFAGCFLSLSVSISLLAQEKAEPWKDVDTVMGRTGQMQAGGVYKYGIPRRDLKVTKDGITIAPGLALGSWVAVFPGTLENLLGVEFDFKETWGVSRGHFEALTLGTLVVLGAIAVVGLVLGGRERQRERDQLTATPEPAVAGR